MQCVWVCACVRVWRGCVRVRVSRGTGAGLQDTIAASLREMSTPACMTEVGEGGTALSSPA